MYTAQIADRGPFVIRYPRGNGYIADWRCNMEEIEVGTGRKLKDGNDMAVLTLGPIGHQASAAISEVEKECPGRSIAHYDMRFVKPLDERLLREVSERFQRVVTVEDGVRNGGFGTAVLEWLSDHGYKTEVVRLGLPDEFVEHGKVDELQHIVGIDKEGIKQSLI